MSVGLGEEYRFPLSSGHPAVFKAHHWQYPNNNSSMDINGIEIDVFQWRATAKSQESVHVDIFNPHW